MTLRISEIEGSDKLRVDLVHNMFDKEYVYVQGYIEHDKDDWNSWYFYIVDPSVAPSLILFGLEELELISNVIRDKQNGIPPKAS